MKIDDLEIHPTVVEMKNKLKLMHEEIKKLKKAINHTKKLKAEIYKLRIMDKTL